MKASNKQRNRDGRSKHPPEQALEIRHTKKEEAFFQKFRNYLKTSRERKLIDKIVNFYGKNFQIPYRDKYNFSERWQKKTSGFQIDNELLQELHPVQSALFFITIIFNVYAIWALSVSRYFGLTSGLLSLTATVLLASLKITEIASKFLHKYLDEEGDPIKPKQFLLSVHQQLLCLVYFVYLVVFGLSTSPIELVCELLIMYFLWKKSATIYQKFKVSGWAIRYQNEIKICELLFNIFVQAHTFAILMFLSAKISPDRNWTEFRNMQSSPIFTQYIYSYYFACTTILTIGYGDITPQDEAEVLIVILIEIVGVLSFGYLLNEMGHTLSKMRSKQEELEKDLQTVSKMAKYYNLQKKLENKAKHFLISNQVQTDSLKPSDQNGIFMKLNDDLRTQITNQNSLSIVKSCIFFLCHWSKGFQTEIARRLEKKLMSPTQTLGEIGKNERIYIIKQGTVEVYLKRFESNQNQKKLLKVIAITPLSEVTDNIYGYTSAFSNRPVYLQAIAKDFTATYSITKQDFLECVNMDTRDFQYYHEIKCRIDQAPICQQWQVPAINNIRQHYRPSKFFLVKKHKQKELISVNLRMPFFTSRRRKMRYHLIHKMRILNRNQIEDFDQLWSSKTIEFQKINTIPVEKDVMKEEEPDNVSDESKPQSEFNIDSDCESVALEHARDWIKSYRSTRAMDEKDNKRKIAASFQHQKNYTNFYPRNNVCSVLLKYEKQNCMEKKIRESIDSDS